MAKSKQTNFSSKNSDFIKPSNLRDKNLFVKLPPSRGDIPGNFFKPYKAETTKKGKSNG